MARNTSPKRQTSADNPAFVPHSPTVFEQLGDDLSSIGSDDYLHNLNLQNHANSNYWENLFSGTEYEDSYKAIMSKYNIDTPNSFWGWLTGQNKTNAYNHAMSRNDELMALQQKMYDEEYNSYANQAELMREAGLNPDLQSVEGGAASPLSPSGNIPDVKAENGLSVVGSLASVAMSAVGIAQNFMSTMQGALNLDSLKLQNIDKMESFALTYLLDNGYSPISTDGSLDYGSSADYNESLVDAAYAFGRKDYGFNNRQARMFANSVSKLSNSPKIMEQYYGFMSRGASNRKSFISDTAGSFYSDQDEAMRLLLGPLLDAQMNATKHKSEFSSVYYSNLDGSAVASAENAVADDKKATVKSNKALLKKWQGSLQSAFDDGNIFAGVLLSILNQLSINSVAGLAKPIF